MIKDDCWQLFVGFQSRRPLQSRGWQAAEGGMYINMAMLKDILSKFIRKLPKLLFKLRLHSKSYLRYSQNSDFPMSTFSKLFITALAGLAVAAPTGSNVFARDDPACPAVPAGDLPSCDFCRYMRDSITACTLACHLNDGLPPQGTPNTGCVSSCINGASAVVCYTGKCGRGDISKGGPAYTGLACNDGGQCTEHGGWDGRNAAKDTGIPGCEGI